MVYCIECIHHDLCQFANINKYMCCGSYISKNDIVEVVRCRDCSVPHNKWTGCPRLNGLVSPTACKKVKSRAEAIEFIEQYKRKHPMGNERRALLSDREV